MTHNTLIDFIYFEIFTEFGKKRKYPQVVKNTKINRHCHDKQTNN